MDLQPIRILLVEDDDDDFVISRDLLIEIFGDRLQLSRAATYDTALTSMGTQHYDVCLIDYRLGGQTGVELVREMSTNNTAVPMILLTGKNGLEVDDEAMRAGATDYLLKHQLDAPTLDRAIRYAIDRQHWIDKFAESLKEQLEVKDRFISHVSHELRSPLAAIHQFTTILLDGLAGDLQPEQHEYLEIALRNVNQLRQMIDDLLEVVRSDTGKLSIEPEPLDLNSAVDEVLKTLESQARVKQIELTSETTIGAPRVFADPHRLREILTNLVGNGIKFTPEHGRVCVFSTAAKTDGFVQISVSDTGWGIAARDQERIFDRLYQVPGTRALSRKGLGLGLTICRDLVRMHDGKIWVESALGRGSTFSFTLPEARAVHLLNMSKPSAITVGTE